MVMTLIKSRPLSKRCLLEQTILPLAVWTAAFVLPSLAKPLMTLFEHHA